MNRLLSLAGNIRLSILLCACVVLGGTSQYIYAYKVPLYLISLVFLGAILSSSNRRSLSKLLTMPVVLVGAFLGLFVIYSIPILPEWWSSLAGRHFSVEGFEVLGEPLPWLPISLYPERTFLALFDFLPIVAIMLITLLSNNRKELLWAKYSFIFIAFISFIFGIIQIILNSDTASLYVIWNTGQPVGFFSNTNHFACMCAMALPIAFNITLKDIGISSSRNPNTLRRFVGTIMIISFSTACILSGSSAGYLMLLMAFIVSPLILIKRAKAFKSASIISACLLFLLILDFVFFSGQLLNFINKFTSVSGTSRIEVYQTTLSFRGDFGFFGIGPGAFENIYKIHENQDRLTQFFINQVHNDYLQLWLEFGMLGLLVILIGVLCFVSLWFRYIKSRDEYIGIYLLSISIPILHSLVDYPFRTIAISSVFVFILSLLCRRLINH